MPRPRLLLAAALFCLNPAAMHARENPYDVVGKVLAPYTRMLAAVGQNRALWLRAHMTDDSSGQSVAGPRVEFAVEMPDRLRIAAPLGGEPITICRDGNKIWGYPASKLKVLLAKPEVKKSLPEPNKEYQLTPFELPIPEKQLAFLPILFRVEEKETVIFNGEEARVLNLQIQKQLASSLELRNATARIWVTEDYRLLNVAAKTERGEGTFQIDSAKFLPALSPKTWQPNAEESADLMPISPAVYDQLVRGFMGRGRDGSQKE